MTEALTVSEAADNVIHLARSAGLGDGDEIGRVLIGLTDLVRALDARMDKLPVADIERLIRQMLTQIRPEFEALWRWRRRAWVIGSAGSTAAVVACAAALVTYHVGRDVGAAESQRWAAWCSDRAHISVQAAGAFCQVPISAR